MSQIILPLTEDAALFDNITLVGAANLIDCINQGENHDSGTTFVTPTTLGFEADFGFVFDIGVFPTDIEANDIALKYAYNCNNGTSRRGQLFVYRVTSQTEPLTDENLIYFKNLDNDWPSTGADFTTYKTDTEILLTEAMKNVVGNDTNLIAIRIKFYTVGSGNQARITSMWLDMADADKGKSISTTSSMTLGNSNDVGQVEPLPSPVVPTGSYLGYSDYMMVVLRSNVQEQSATRTGLVTKGLLTGGNVTLNARNPLEITLNCIIIATSDAEMKSRMQNVKKAFAKGLQFMQLDRDNFDVPAEFRRGFFGILKSPIESRRVGNYNREFTIVIEVPDGFYQSEQEFVTVLNVLNAGYQWIDPDTVLTTVGVRNVPLMFSPTAPILQDGTNSFFGPWELASSSLVPFGGSREPLSIIELKAVSEAPPSPTIYTINNESRGESLIWEGEILEDDVITIDSFNERVFKTTAIGSIITDVTSGVSPGSVWPKFNPTNDFFTRAEVGTLPSVPVTQDKINNFCSFFTNWTPGFFAGGVDLDVTIKWRRVF